VRTQVHTARLIQTADLDIKTRHNTYRLLADASEGDFTDHDGDHTLGGCTCWSTITAR
jgi:aminoglycoside 2'-N-acetyltransferase I